MKKKKTANIYTAVSSWFSVSSKWSLLLIFMLLFFTNCLAFDQTNLLATVAYIARYYTYNIDNHFWNYRFFSSHFCKPSWKIKTPNIHLILVLYCFKDELLQFAYTYLGVCLWFIGMNQTREKNAEYKISYCWNCLIRLLIFFLIIYSYLRQTTLFPSTLCGFCTL